MQGLRPGLYGRGLLIHSLNFNQPGGQVWLPPAADGNPYRTLPPVFGPEHRHLNALLARLAGGDGESSTIDQGGLAMIAYNLAVLEQIDDTDRQCIESALFRYCELDTLAMVMLVQGLMALRGRPLTIAGA